MCPQGIHAHSHRHQTAIATTLWLSAAPEVVTMTTPSVAGNHTVATAIACLRGTYMKYRYIHTIINNACQYNEAVCTPACTIRIHGICTYTRSCIRWTCHPRMHRKLSRRQHPVYPVTIIPHKEQAPKPVGWTMCFLLMTLVPVQKLCVNIYVYIYVCTFLIRVLL